MIKFLLNLLNLNFLLGYIQNGVFPSKLSSLEEEQLIKDLFIENKHEESRKKLIIHNLRLVGHIAKKYESTGYDLED